MKSPNLGEKRVADLSIDDFVGNPVWTWSDEDGDMVIPLDVTDHVVLEENNALFVGCTFCFNDGTELVGVLSIRTSDRFVYLLSFPQNEGGFLDYPLHPNLKSDVSRSQLAGWLQKEVGQVFPIQFVASQALGGGKPLEGVVE